MCLSQWNFVTNFELQYGQLKGFSPVCERIWHFILDGAFIIVEQYGHPYVWGPRWIGSFCNK